MFAARRRALACLLTAGALGGAAAQAGQAHAAPADVPTATVTGPIPVTPTSRPFLATDRDLARYGYVEEEFYVSGDAFTYAPTNTLATASKVTTGGPNGDGTYPFKTRIVVRRPASTSTFNGTTLLEWNNVTAGFDIEWNWLNDPDYLMRHGYAWVGVSAQRAGVQALKTLNPARYGDLDVTSTTPTTPPSTDQLSFDIYGAVAKAIDGLSSGVDPMGGLDTERIVATGESQSGSRLNAYYNAVHPLHELADAFLITVAGGTLRADTPDTKAIRVLTDFENAAPPTDADTASYRRWDVAGGSHLPFKAYQTFAPIVARDIPIPATADCTLPALSRVAWPYVYNRALDALVSWERDGTAPPQAPRFEYENGTIRRDEHGITRGGIRLPEVEVPTATNSGFNETQPGATSLFSAFCRLLGSSVPFAREKLDALYGDYGAYVDAVAPKTQAVRDAGFITADDVERVNADAARFARLRPSAPKLEPGSTLGGSFAFASRGPEPVSTDTTYEVQRRSGAPGAAWETIAGAAALKARRLARAPEAEGTFSYRVRSTTIVPALYPDPQRAETTPWSQELTGVKVDRSVPAPVPTPDRAPEYAGRGGWWKGSVRVGFATSDTLPDGTPGVGLDLRSLPAPVTVTRTQRVQRAVRDVAGNSSPQGARTFQVDATAPTATIGCPSGVIVVGTARSLSVRAKDGAGGSGLAGKARTRVKVNTRTAGRRTVTTTVRDRVGNRRTATCAVRIVRKPAARCTARRGTVRCALTLRPGIRAVQLRLSRGGRTVATKTVRRSGTVTLTRRAAKGRYAVTVKVDGAVVQRRRVTV